MRLQTLLLATIAIFCSFKVWEFVSSAALKEPNYRVGIDVGGTKVAFIAQRFDEPGYENLILHMQFPTGTSFNGATLQRHTRAFLAQFAAKTGHDVAFNRSDDDDEQGNDGEVVDPNLRSFLQQFVVGVSIPGLVAADSATTIALTPDVNLTGYDVADDQLLRACAGLIVLNDIEAAKAQALDEIDLDRKQEVVVLVVGTGLGAAYVTRGQDFGGANGWAGEIGMSPAGGGDDDETTWDSLMGGASLLRRLNMSGAAAAAALNDPESSDHDRVRQQIERAGRAFGQVIALHINVFNPSAVVVGGGTLRYPLYLQTALRVAKQRAISSMYKVAQIYVAAQPQLLPVVGASKAAVNQWKTRL